MLSVDPFAQRGLDEAFGLAVGARGVRPCALMAQFQLLTGLSEAVGAVAAAVVGQQGTDSDAVPAEEVERVLQEQQRGLGLLVGQELREGDARVIVDGDVQCLAAGMPSEAATSAVATQGDLLILRQAFDVEVQQVSGMRMLVAHHRRTWMQIAPTA